MRMTFRAAGAACAAAVLVVFAAVAPSLGAAPAEGKDYSADLRQLSKKLDEVLAEQKALKEQLDTQHAAMMEEMRILKVRSYQSRPRATP